MCDKADFAPEVVCHSDKDPKTGQEIPTCKCGQLGAPNYDISSRMLDDDQEDFTEVKDRAEDVAPEDGKEVDENGQKEDKKKSDDETYKDVVKVLDDLFKKVMTNLGL